MRRTSFGLVAMASSVLVACGGGGSQVSFVSNEQPSGYGNAQGPVAPAAAHREDPNGASELGEDDIIEPEHPAADTKQERALVHIHGPKEVCSGVVMGPRVIATAQRCLRGQGKGVVTFAANQAYRVEVASSTLTWTNRTAKYAILPQCEETEIDVAILVLDEPVPAFVVPLKLTSTPNIGAHVQALGFGHCAGSKQMKERTGTVRSRDGQTVVIDVPLCKGDLGGPVLDGNDGDVVGLVSHRDDPEGSPLKTTTIARLDGTSARHLVRQAQVLVDSGDVAKVRAVACR